MYWEGGGLTNGGSQVEDQAVTFVQKRPTTIGKKLFKDLDSSLSL